MTGSDFTDPAVQQLADMLFACMDAGDSGGGAIAEVWDLLACVDRRLTEGAQPMKIDTNTITTIDNTLNSWFVSIVKDEDGGWVVAERTTNVYGHGPSLLHALCDFHAALCSHHGVLDGARLTPQMEREYRAIRRLLDLVDAPDGSVGSVHTDARDGLTRDWYAEDE